MSCTKLPVGECPDCNATLKLREAASEINYYYAQRYFVNLFEAYFARSANERSRILRKIQEVIAEIWEIDTLTPHLNQLVAKRDRIHPGSQLVFKADSAEAAEFDYQRRTIMIIKAELATIPEMYQLLWWGESTTGIEAIKAFKKLLSDTDEIAFLETVTQLLQVYMQHNI